MLLLLLLYLPFFLFILIIFFYPYMLHFFFVKSLAICPRLDKLTVVYLLFSKFNSSQMLEYDDYWKLMTTRIFSILSGIVPDEKLLTSFLSFSSFTIIGDDSNTSILIPLTNPCMSFSFSYKWGSLLLNFNIPDACPIKFVNWDLSLFYF